MEEDSRKSWRNTRLLGGTELNWCKAVAGGTGITALALQAYKHPNIPLLKKALRKIQNDHPILNSMVYKNTSNGGGSACFTINPPIPHQRLKIISLSTTLDLLRTLTSRGSSGSLSPLHLILEHELNVNEWSTGRSLGMGGLYLWFANLYTLPEEKWLLVMRFHTVVCDRTTVVTLIKELSEVMGEREGGRYAEEGNVAIEELIPIGKAKKTMWAHGKDVVAYSVNSFRLRNLKFKDVKGPLRSQVARFKMNTQETHMLLTGCKSRGIKLCGVLVAATLLAVYNSKRQANKNNRKKYGVFFLNDCRSHLQPPLSRHNFGFYHSAISTIQEVKQGENLWDLATRSYTTFVSSKNNNKHFTDMADLNFLMSKAADNPSLTPKSSLRTSLVSAFEDPVIESSSEMGRGIFLEDFVGCASIHGVGPSIAIFDTIVDGQLDCVCVYPSPLHSREQMQEVIANMKITLVDGIKMEENIET
ncbi:hypothetical protein OSB04_021713 [Centaurea solstitialis]|uniref:Uncharacterized protein n=1 Tax=Centaurea solstitialis TaxID=347529 RepID=A0AA38WEF7_9ASTR|nr:hypothetical protein OSB04_021713 [Centaurea solstitialis]